MINENTIACDFCGVHVHLDFLREYAEVDGIYRTDMTFEDGVWRWECPDCEFIDHWYHGD